MPYVFIICLTTSMAVTSLTKAFVTLCVFQDTGRRSKSRSSLCRFAHLAIVRCTELNKWSFYYVMHELITYTILHSRKKLKYEPEKDKQLDTHMANVFKRNICVQLASEFRLPNEQVCAKFALLYN